MAISSACGAAGRVIGHRLELQRRHSPRLRAPTPVGSQVLQVLAARSCSSSTSTSSSGGSIAAISSQVLRAGSRRRLSESISSVTRRWSRSESIGVATAATAGARAAIGASAASCGEFASSLSSARRAGRLRAVVGVELADLRARRPSSLAGASSAGVAASLRFAGGLASRCRRGSSARGAPSSRSSSGFSCRSRLDFLVEFERRQLQQPDRLLQLRRERQVLG